MGLTLRNLPQGKQVGPDDTGPTCFLHTCALDSLRNFGMRANENRNAPPLTRAHNPKVVGSNPAPATMKPQVGSKFASDLFRVSSPLGYQVVPKWSRTLLRLPTQGSFVRLTVAALSLKHRRNRPRLHANTHLGRKMERLFYATRPSAYADGLPWKLGAPCHSEGGVQAA